IPAENEKAKIHRHVVRPPVLVILVAPQEVEFPMRGCIVFDHGVGQYSPHSAISEFAISDRQVVVDLAWIAKTKMDRDRPTVKRQVGELDLPLPAELASKLVIKCRALSCMERARAPAGAVQIAECGPEIVGRLSADSQRVTLFRKFPRPTLYPVYLILAALGGKQRIIQLRRARRGAHHCLQIRELAGHGREVKARRVARRE